MALARCVTMLVGLAEPGAPVTAGGRGKGEMSPVREEV